jgi:hypothetical protein
MKNWSPSHLEFKCTQASLSKDKTKSGRPVQASATRERVSATFALQ